MSTAAIPSNRATLPRRLPAVRNLRIRGRLLAGFGTLCLVLAAAVGYSVYTAGGIALATDRMVNLRVPVSQTSTELVRNLYSTLAALRGYLLTGSPQDKADRAAMWAELDHNRAIFDHLAERFTSPANRQNWAHVKDILGQFRAAQDKAESIAFTPDAYPATRLLLTEAVPRADLMIAQITKMIDEEATLEATPARKALLKQMADTRGNFSLAAADLRAFLLSGDASFKTSFDARWAAAGKAAGAVKAAATLLTPGQKTAFDTFEKKQQELAPLPAKIFQIRESAEWNMPVHVLISEAAPKALQILDILDGPKGADGTRSGGLKQGTPSFYFGRF